MTWLYYKGCGICSIVYKLFNIIFRTYFEVFSCWTFRNKVLRHITSIRENFYKCGFSSKCGNFKWKTRRDENCVYLSMLSFCRGKKGQFVSIKIELGNHGLYCNLKLMDEINIMKRQHCNWRVLLYNTKEWVQSSAGLIILEFMEFFRDSH